MVSKQAIRMKGLVSAIRLFILLGAVNACKMLDNPTLPENTISPTVYHSREGALTLYEGANQLFPIVIINSIVHGGLITDELNASDLPSINEQSTALDSRRLTSSGRVSDVMSDVDIHMLRGQAQLARDALSRYAKDMSPTLRGRMFMVEAFAVLMLAEQYCAGVSLSTLEFDGDYTYQPSIGYIDTYNAAIKLFDSAIAASSDSSDLVTLGMIGKARALLGTGKLSEANEISASIGRGSPYRYNMNEIKQPDTWKYYFINVVTVSDREGINGLPFISSQDPRSASDFVTVTRTTTGTTEITRSRQTYFPRKLAAGTFTLASSKEARLIEAEFLLNNNKISEWLKVLNDLRTDGNYALRTNEDQTIDTLWKPGHGEVALLAPLKDPGTSDARIDLMFEERAYWLYLTGQRLPDLRRMVRQYGRDSESVFPTGPYAYSNSIDAFYGSDINIPISRNESYNRLSKGCLNRDQ